jgi:protoporphyrinogen IX oxidase
MLWIKSLHIVFVASWFAGLFYLPRIFVNLAMVAPGSMAERERLLLMARKLLRFTRLLSWPAVGFGIWLLVLLWPVPGFGQGPGNTWLWVKLAIVVATLVYQELCGQLLRRLCESSETRGHVWFRWFNELPVLMLLATVILVVVKPF